MNEPLRALVKEKLKTHEDRFLHICGVEEVAIELAKIYHASIEKASIAALAHDLFKHESIEEQTKWLDEKTIFKFKDIPVLYHAYSAAAYIEKELGIHDQDIINAVRYHVWGRPNMSLLEKIIYVADISEPNRDFLDAKVIRDLAKQDLDQALVLAMKLTIDYVIDQGFTPSIEQYEAFHYYKEVKRG